MNIPDFMKIIHPPSLASNLRLGWWEAKAVRRRVFPTVREELTEIMLSEIDADEDEDDDDRWVMDDDDDDDDDDRDDCVSDLLSDWTNDNDNTTSIAGCEALRTAECEAIRTAAKAKHEADRAAHVWWVRDDDDGNDIPF